ncbi:acetyltransferase [Saccharibacillus sp. O23]|uniref:acyltransferase family protein n=1 Tax=Saccharibacillus sp. O23 TaxID=2009338 RepID=UPI000B4E210A|nr:acyltransferase family protein [Saccharibacillus sp. O23]OWR27726.1 acetyltransferase [Saccharibacillus sp. O23]
MPKKTIDSPHINVRPRPTISSNSVRPAGSAEARGAKRHIRGLDGLRAVAVLAVIAYHFNLDFLPGGLFGVGLFFVLSGYLITDILLSQRQEQGSVRFVDFYIRRARRLLPGMFAVMATVMVWLLFADPARLASLRGDIVAGTLYISNWWYIFRHVSYFESFGPPSPFGHFWSLAVEEQFYIVWPLLLVGLIALLKRRRLLTVYILTLAVVSAAAMAILYNPDLDPSRVYYGTDTRAFALLAGAALAVVWPSRSLSAAIGPAARFALEAVGLAALAYLAYAMLTGSEYDSSLYGGGMALQAIAAALLIGALAHPASLLSRVFGIAPLRWIGRHSYGLYLWHYPVIALTTPSVDTDGVDWLRIALQLTATFVLAALSLKYIEDPIRLRGFRAFFASAWSTRRRPRRVLLLRTALLTSAVLVTAAALRLTGAPPATTVSAVPNKAAASYAASAAPKPTTLAANTANRPTAPNKLTYSSGGEDGQEQTGDSGSPKNAEPSTEASQGSADSRQASQEETDSNPEAVPPASGRVKYTVVGDSVILDAKPYLEQNIADVYVSGKIGRQMREASDLLAQFRAQGQLGGRVVIELGTNGSFNSKNLTAVLDSLRDKEKVYLVTVRVPRSWERTVNRALNKAASEYPNVSLIDWHGASAGRDDYFAADGVHLTPEGSEAFADLIKRTIVKKELSMR